VTSDDADATVVWRIIRKRRSTRRFAEAPVAQATLLRLVEAGIWAPSGSNAQNQRFLIINDLEELRRLGKIRFVWPYKNSSRARARDATGLIGLAAAGILVFSDCLETDRRDAGEYHIWQKLEIQNSAAAIQNILLLATSMRLASCWISASDEMNYSRLMSGQSWRTALNTYDIPLHYKLQGIVLLGHPLKLDESGLPAGERHHGATMWRPVERGPVEQYLIGKRTASAVMRDRRGDGARGAVAALAAVIRALLSVVRLLDRGIRRLEVRRVRDGDE